MAKPYVKALWKASCQSLMAKPYAKSVCQGLMSKPCVKALCQRLMSKPCVKALCESLTAGWLDGDVQPVLTDEHKLLPMGHVYTHV